MPDPGSGRLLYQIPDEFMTDHACPSCGVVSLRRCGRKGLWERFVLPLFGIFPWRCARCRARFRLSHRGLGYARVKGGENALFRDSK